VYKKNDENILSLINILFKKLMAYLCLQCTPNVQINYFMFHCQIYRLFVLYTGWKRDSLLMMNFVNICSTWSMVQIKMRFVLWITRNDVNGVSSFHLSYLIILMAYLCSLEALVVQIKYFIFDLQTTCAKYGLETLFSPNDDIRKCLFDIKHGSTKNAFCVVNNMKWRKWVKFVSPFLFNNTYGLPVLTMDTKCPNQVFYVWLVHLQPICAK
jgi:hypothetical protein